MLVRRLDPELPLPLYALPGDAGADIVDRGRRDARAGRAGACCRPGSRSRCPSGYAAFVHPRSGLAARAGLGLVNAPGTIDAGYRGEIKVIVINHDPARAAARSPAASGSRNWSSSGSSARSFVEVDELPASEPRRGRARLDRRRGRTGGRSRQELQ